MAKEFTRSGFLALYWTIACIALCLVLTGLYIRRRFFGRFMVDDFLVCFALICLWTECILQTAYIDLIFENQHKILSKAPKESFADVALEYFKLQWGIAYVFFTGLWSIKGSLLAYYGGLTHRLPFYRRIWWAFIVLTILTWIGALIAYALLNGLRIAKDFQNKAIVYQFSADLTTDVCITALPLALIFRTQLPTKKKLALGGVCSLGLIVTSLSIARFSVNRGTAIPTWLSAWSLIELGVSVCVACLMSFRILAVGESRHSKQSSSGLHYFSGRSRGSSSTAAKDVKSSRSRHQRSFLGSRTGNRGDDQSNESMDVELLETSPKRGDENNVHV